MSHGYYEMTWLEEKKSYQKRTALKCIKAKWKFKIVYRKLWKTGNGGNFYNLHIDTM